MGEYQSGEELAIFAVRDFLVGLLENKNWCEAERVGKALKILVGDRPIRPEQDRLNEQAEKSVGSIRTNR